MRMKAPHASCGTCILENFGAWSRENSDVQLKSLWLLLPGAAQSAGVIGWLSGMVVISLGFSIQL